MFEEKPILGLVRLEAAPPRTGGGLLEDLYIRGRAQGLGHHSPPRFSGFDISWG